MQTGDEQGDLLAWSPDGSQLAYITREANGWFTGSLALASGADFSEHTPLTQNVAVYGDLTWSRTGEQIAFVGLRPNPQTFTVYVYDLPTGRLTDLFPGDAAVTDAYASKKAVERWNDMRHVLVILSCGPGCERRVEVNTLDATQRPGDETYKALGTAIAPTRRLVEYDPDSFPKVMIAPNWSPDGARMVYFDRRANPWVLVMQPPGKFGLDVGSEAALESYWSPDSEWLAIRTDGHVLVYRFGCTPEPTPAR
jgi:Tol biopolymer transport system component